MAEKGRIRRRLEGLMSFLLPNSNNDFPTRNLTFVVASFFGGFIFVYVFAYVGINLPGLLKPIGGFLLLTSLIFGSLYLSQFFRKHPITYWGSGLAIIFSAIRLYVALGSEEITPCHTSTGKWAIPIMLLIGAPLLFHGMFRLLGNTAGATQNTPQTVKIEEQQIAGSKVVVMAFVSSSGNGPEPSETDKAPLEEELEVRNRILIVTIFFALIILINQFILGCWFE